MLVLPWETRAVFPCSPPPPFSVVYTNVGPWRVNNKGELVRWGLLMLSAKFGVPIRLIPRGVCLRWHRCLLFAMLGDEPPCFSLTDSVFVNRFPFRLPFWFVFWNWCWCCVEVIHSNSHKMFFVSSLRKWLLLLSKKKKKSLCFSRYSAVSWGFFFLNVAHLSTQ